MGRAEALPVWFYWEGPRPSWIERCQATIARHAANPRMLDWPAFDALWDLDRDIDLGPLYVAHRADFIRAFLLARHGGLWIDSDCIVMRPLAEMLASLDRINFIAHRERQGQFSNGFVGASPGSEIARQFYGRVRDTLRSGAPRGWTSLGAEPLGALLSGAPRGFRELDCRTIQPICWSRPAEFFAVRPPGEHGLHVDADALTYMLSNSAVQSYLRVHPEKSLMTEGSFFRHLLDRSGVAAVPDEAGERRAVWEHLHRKALDGSGESLSGPGSSLAQTRVVRARLDGLLRRLGVTTMLDAPCGDHYWLRHAELTANYVGVDVVPDLIERNRRRHPERQFLLADLVSDDLPRADLILCRDALVQYSFRDGLAMLRNFRKSGAEWLLATTFPGRDDNRDIATGDWRPLNLELPPFSFPQPHELVVERCSEGDGRYCDKSLGLWRFAELSLEAGGSQG
jgi:hypothetical protein